MIGNSYTYSAQELQVLAQLSPDPRSAKGTDWEDSSISAVKSALKSFYIKEQGNLCCYCNQHRPTLNHRLWDLEHVVSRSTHPGFLFTPQNLAASCPDCNTAKAEKSTLKNRRRVTYPSRSEDFVIVHPHFDEFSDHILQFGFVYVPRTPKGTKTIYICDLLRFSQEFLEWPSPLADDRFESEVEMILKEGQKALAIVRALRAALPAE